MAPPPILPLAFLFLTLHGYYFSSSLAAAVSSFKPNAIILPVLKHHATKQYFTTIQQQTPLQSERVVIHLGGPYLWINCESGYNSTTYVHVPCGPACPFARYNGCLASCTDPPGPLCANETCFSHPENPITNTATLANLLKDVIVLRSTDGKNVGPPVTIPNYIFTCGINVLLKGLAGRSRGMAGLGRFSTSLPNQLASTFGFARKFAICLFSSSLAPGVIFFGDGPYVLLPGIDASQFLPSSTPLLLNPLGTAQQEFIGKPSDEYFIKVTSIKVNGKTVPTNTTLLNIDEQGRGGTKLSTVIPYTTLHSSIYKALEDAFVREAAAMNITRVAAVKPFGACFKNLVGTKSGARVPEIDLVLDTESTVWQIFGANSMVEVMREGVMCLAFLNGGVNPRTSIVVGGYQLENILVQFDLASSRMSFSPNLNFAQTTCANFNFTSA